MSVTCKVETITPEIAKDCMRQNTGNFRKRDAGRVSAYSQDMRLDLWDLNGESIVFGADGQLKNGQHRLEAIIVSGHSIQCVVVRGITCDASRIDRGKPRSVAQWIAHSGVKNAVLVAAISRQCIGHEKGIWNHKGWGVAAIIDTEVLAFAHNHHEAINNSVVGARLTGVPQSNFVSTMFIGCRFRDINRSETARWFRDAIVDGSDLSDIDAALHFRNRVSNNGSKTGTAKLTPFMIRMLLTVAWNKTAAGVECGPNGLRLRLTGPQKQTLPNEIAQVDDI